MPHERLERHHVDAGTGKVSAERAPQCVHVDSAAALVTLGDAGGDGVAVENPHKLVGHVEQGHVVSRPHDTGDADTLPAHRFGFLGYPRPQFGSHVGQERQRCPLAALGVSGPQHDYGPAVVEQHVARRERRQFAPPQPGRDEHGVEQRTFPPQAFEPFGHVGPQPLPAAFGGGDERVERQFGPLPRRPRLRRPGVAVSLDGRPPVLGERPQPGHGEQPPQFGFGECPPLPPHVVAPVDAGSLAQAGERIHGQPAGVDEPVAPRRQRAELGIDGAGCRAAGHEHGAGGIDDGLVGQGEQPGHPRPDGVAVQVPQPAEPALGDGGVQVAGDILDVPRRSGAVCSPAALVGKVSDVGVDVLDDGRVGMVGDVRLGSRQHAGTHFLGTGFKVGEHGPGSVERLAPGRHPPHPAVAPLELCRVGAAPHSNTGHVARRRRCLASLAAGVSPHGDEFAAPGDEFGPLGQRPGDERLEHGAH